LNRLVMFADHDVKPMTAVMAGHGQGRALVVPGRDQAGTG
jgi:hypothetical protein